MIPRFHDRFEAGRRVALELRYYSNQPDVLVLALPRGGVPVGYEIARELQAPLDVFVVRKLGVPGQEELAMGAIATGGVRVLNQQVIRELDITPEEIEAVALRQEQELERRERLYRGDRPPLEITGRRVILVDDGLATGSTMRAAARAIRGSSPAELVIAVPLAARETCKSLEAEADRVICAATPDPFHAVGIWYENFAQTSDGEVRDLLEKSRHFPGSEGGKHGHVAPVL